MHKSLALVVTIIFIGVAAGGVGAQVPALPDPAKWEDASFVRIFEQNAGALARVTLRTWFDQRRHPLTLSVAKNCHLARAFGNMRL